eukprot:53834-Rhodomonas_salina.2
MANSQISARWLASLACRKCPQTLQCRTLPPGSEGGSGTPSLLHVKTCQQKGSCLPTLREAPHCQFIAFLLRMLLAAPLSLLSYPDTFLSLFPSKGLLDGWFVDCCSMKSNLTNKITAKRMGAHNKRMSKIYLGGSIWEEGLRSGGVQGLVVTLEARGGLGRDATLKASEDARIACSVVLKCSPGTGQIALEVAKLQVSLAAYAYVLKET